MNETKNGDDYKTTTKNTPHIFPVLRLDINSLTQACFELFGSSNQWAAGHE